MIRTVPKAMVDEIWPAVRTMLAAALAYNPFLSIDDLQQLARDRDGIDLLVAIEDGKVLGAAVIELQEYPRCKTGHVLALGGRDGFYERHLPAMTDELERWSLAQGGQSISMLGRTGWSKFVARRGWQVMPAIGAWKQLGQPQVAAGGDA